MPSITSRRCTWVFDRSPAPLCGTDGQARGRGRADGEHGRPGQPQVPRLATVDVVELEERLDRRLSWGARKLELDAGRYEVVLPPDAVADSSSRSVTRPPDGKQKRGAVSSRPEWRDAGGRVSFPTRFSLRSDPFAEGLECTPFLVSERRPRRVGLRQRPPARADRMDP